MTIDTDSPLAIQLSHAPFGEVATALRAAVEHITRTLGDAVRNSIPQMSNLTSEELRDSTPEILYAIANALGSDDPKVISELVACAPRQGKSMFNLKFDVVEVMQEVRLLRAIIVTEVEKGMGRQMDAAESAALHAAIDVMLQRSIVALVHLQKAQLARAAEVELRFLSFLSHDLNNNLHAVTLWLHFLEIDLRASGGFPAAVQSLSQAQKTITETIDGMKRILEHERLRERKVPSPRTPTDLHALANRIVGQVSLGAAHPEIAIRVEVPPGTVWSTDGSLVTVVLQNLVGNALKYSDEGTVRIGWDEENGTLWVSDEGPGIAPEHIATIFDAFQRGDIRGREGLGLGLAIASKASELLGAMLTVESELDKGSTFRLSLGAASSRPSRSDD